MVIPMHSLCHWNAVQWKHHIISTIVVLSLQRLRGEFPSHMYHIYHGTPVYSTCHSSRLISVWRVPWYPRSCSHSTIGNRPNIMGLRHRPMYRATIADKQQSFLVDPGHFLHARIILLCSSLGTMIRSPRLGCWKGRLGLPSPGNSIAKNS